MNKAKLFEMVGDIQRQRPGWRFSLLGGDVSFGYRLNKDGSLKRNKKREIIVDKSVKARQVFGWHAEFFGEEDPSVNYGERHASARYVEMDDAILIACAQATKKIREQDAKKKTK